MTAAGLSPPGRVIDVLPVGLFGAVMGLTGLSLAWRLAASRYEWSTIAADVLAALAVLVFVVLSAAFLLKLVVAGSRVRADFMHPVVSPLFGTVFVSMLLLPIVIAPSAPRVALAVWIAGVVGMISFAWVIVDRWTSHPHEVLHVSPTWLVPAVGLLDIPLAMPVLGLGELRPLMVLGLAVGLFFAVPLFTMIFSRLVFERPLAETLEPTLLILVAPFAVGTSAYIATAGHADLFAEALFVLTLFLLVVLSGRLRHLARCCPFRTAWWAVSFPLAAADVAAFRMSSMLPSPFYGWAAGILLVVATGVIGWLLLRTLTGMARGELRTLIGG